MRGLRWLLPLRRALRAGLAKVTTVFRSRRSCVVRLEPEIEAPVEPPLPPPVEVWVLEGRDALRRSAADVALGTARRLGRTHGASSQGRLGAAGGKEIVAWRFVESSES